MGIRSDSPGCRADLFGRHWDPARGREPREREVEMRKRSFGLMAVAAAVALVTAACASEQGAGGGGAGGEDGGEPQDLLATVQDRGVLRVATDPEYPPQSFLNEETGQWEGFDIDVATEIANRMGVEIEFITPNWGQIIAGSWQDRWDVSVGSMTVTPERDQVLHFMTPYYYTPAAVAVREEDAAQYSDVATDFDGASIGVCGGCTYEFYLDKSLEIPGEDIEFVIDDAEIRTYNTDIPAIKDLEVGRLDAAMSSLTTLRGAEEEGSPIEIIDNVYYEPLSVAVDRSAPLDPTSLVEEIDRIVQEMHDDGTLSQLSMEWFGEDLSQKT
jgi:polar amino acid transport system substrate-binding protein